MCVHVPGEDTWGYLRAGSCWDVLNAWPSGIILDCHIYYLLFQLYWYRVIDNMFSYFILNFCFSYWDASIQKHCGLSSEKNKQTNKTNQKNNPTTTKKKDEWRSGKNEKLGRHLEARRNSVGRIKPVETLPWFPLKLLEGFCFLSLTFHRDSRKICISHNLFTSFSHISASANYILAWVCVHVYTHMHAHARSNREQ